MLGGLVNISGGVYNVVYQMVDVDQLIVDLGGGNFVIVWDIWDDIDGDDKGLFLWIFRLDGIVVIGVIIFYVDINLDGMGD